MARKLMAMNPIRLFLDNQFQGGILMWVIFATGVLSLYLGLDKILFLNNVTRYHKRFVKGYNEIAGCNTTPKKIGSEEYDILLSQLTMCNHKGSKECNGYFREFLICMVPVLERHFTTMNAWISVAPLLGLLGTVFGMVQTFTVIMNFGIGNPALTAEGISVALLTTQAGLIVAFPIMLFHNYLFNKKDVLISAVLKDFERIAQNISSIDVEE